jgi:MYXO-CTERM domain-containing protein
MLAPLALAGATLGLAANPAQAITLFAGPYAPANWTQSIGGDGSINTGFAPGSITLNGSDDYSGYKNVDFTIAAPASGTVSFDWSYSSSDSDGPEYDPFGYLLNGSFAQLTDSAGSSDQSGTASFSVLAGDVFGFRQNSDDSQYGGASTTISYFNGPTPVPVPVPGPLPLLGAGAAWGWSRRLRHRLDGPLITPPQT